MRLYCDWNKDILKIHYTTNEDGENEMMKLVRYNIAAGTSSSSGNDHGSIEGGSAG